MNMCVASQYQSILFESNRSTVSMSMRFFWISMLIPSKYWVWGLGDKIIGYIVVFHIFLFFR